jgi:hypothetical protein
VAYKADGIIEFRRSVTVKVEFNCDVCLFCLSGNLRSSAHLLLLSNWPLALGGMEAAVTIA